MTEISQASIIIEGPQQGPSFLFAHGAGAGMQHEFMQDMAARLVQKQIRVIRFNFPYMEKSVFDGKRRPPDRAPKLLDAMGQVLESVTDQPMVIGGKSMGGRMASLMAQHPLVSSVACLGFPFHPPGKPENYKGAHLETIDKPCLIIQGARDTFGCESELSGFAFSTSVTTMIVPDGDHSFKPRKSSGFTEPQNRQMVADRLALFIKGVSDV